MKNYLLLAPIVLLFGCSDTVDVDATNDLRFNFFSMCLETTTAGLNMNSKEVVLIEGVDDIIVECKAATKELIKTKYKEEKE